MTSPDKRLPFVVLSFRWGREARRKGVGWTRCPDVRFSRRGTAESYARLRVQSGAISGAAVLDQRHDDGAMPEVLSHFGDLPDDLEI